MALAGSLAYHARGKWRCKINVIKMSQSRVTVPADTEVS